MRNTRSSILVFGAALFILYSLVFGGRKSKVNETPHEEHKKVSSPPSGASLASTVAVIRYNAERPERKKSLQRMAPFFHSLHHSMPQKIDGAQVGYRPDAVTLEEDVFPHPYYTYKSNADLMYLILNKYPEVTGMFYFHFDAWIDPTRFEDMNFDNVWWPTQHRIRNVSGTFVEDTQPAFGCHFFDMASKERAAVWPWTWWFFRENEYQDTLISHNKLAALTNYGLQKDEFCIGWSDLYYIPRRFFVFYIELANMFTQKWAFHECCVPTIIALLKRLHPGQTVVDELNDCWGDCCSTHPSVEDIEQYRCGHRFDWQDAESTHAILSRLDKQIAAIAEKSKPTSHAVP